jgi:hypothetical protein
MMDTSRPGRTVRRAFAPPLVAMALACGGGPVAPATTGLVGVVLRGPVTPVCLPDPPCDAPFRAHFTVWRASSSVAGFESDTLGRFLVWLPPGRYTVRPGTDAPILSPELQSKTVTVAGSGLTYVQLDFDTGIR